MFSVDCRGSSTMLREVPLAATAPTSRAQPFQLVRKICKLDRWRRFSPSRLHRATAAPIVSLLLVWQWFLQQDGRIDQAGRVNAGIGAASGPELFLASRRGHGARAHAAAPIERRFRTAQLNNERLALEADRHIPTCRRRPPAVRPAPLYSIVFMLARRPLSGPHGFGVFRD